MATNLGAGVVIDVEAVERAGMASKRPSLYLEGYLLDSPGTYAAARASGRDREVRRGDGVALSLSDPFLVERHGEPAERARRREVDLLFANEEEAQRLTGADDLAGAARRPPSARA